MRPERPVLNLIGVTITGLAGVLLMIAPLGLGADTWPGPHLLLMALAFWCVRRPVATPPLLVFALGLFHDLLRAGPVGAELFALLIVIQTLRGLSSRKPPNGLLEETLRFAAAMVAYSVIVSALLALAYAAVPPLDRQAARVLLTVALYPVAALVLQRLWGVRSDDARFLHLSDRHRRSAIR